jgi:hypothetical protein
MNDATSLITSLRESGQPIVLTINDSAEIVVNDEGSYQKLLELAERVGTIEALKIGIDEMKTGKGEPAEKVLQELMDSVPETVG